MASDLVNPGALPNDGTGTALREVVTAFNCNFILLDGSLAEILSSLIAGMVVNGSGHLIVTYADSVSVDIGNVTGPVGVATAAVNGSGHLILTRANGTTIDAGSTVGPTGLGITSAAINGSRHLILTYTDGSTADAGFLGAGVTGPVSSVVNNIPLFNATDGSVIKDSGLKIGTAANNIVQLGADAKVPSGTLAPFTGDTGAGGTKGVVPAPASGDAASNRFLKADGTWAAIPSSVPTTAGAVGTYGLFQNNGSFAVFGDTIAGSGLTPAAISNVEGASPVLASGTVMAGTWRCMGYGPTGYGSTFLRVA